MARNEKDGSGIQMPWDEQASPSNVIRCPKCHNNGMDGSITGFAGQWGITRKCTKCGQQWSGGIGVPKADFSEGPSIPGVERKEEPALVRNTEPQYRDPNKNYGDEES